MATLLSASLLLISGRFDPSLFEGWGCTVGLNLVIVLIRLILLPIHVVLSLFHHSKN